VTPFPSRRRTGQPFPPPVFVRPGVEGPFPSSSPHLRRNPSQVLQAGPLSLLLVEEGQASPFLFRFQPTPPPVPASFPFFFSQVVSFPKPRSRSAPLLPPRPTPSPFVYNENPSFQGARHTTLCWRSRCFFFLPLFYRGDVPYLPPLFSCRGWRQFHFFLFLFFKEASRPSPFFVRKVVPRRKNRPPGWNNLSFFPQLRARIVPPSPVRRRPPTVP